MPLRSPIRNCTLLLPGYELDGFPRNLPSTGAAQLLSGWVALWHPQIIHALQTAPCWRQAENAPSDLAGSLFVVPGIVKSDMHSQYDSIGNADDTVLLEPTADWRAFQQIVLRESGISQDSQPVADMQLVNELCPEFAALGYAYLQIQLMTRQLRYTSNLDQVLFSEQLTAAADAACAGTREDATDMLQACFDSLGQERDHYYSLDVNLIDITLLASTTLANSLARQLEQQTPTSYLATADLLTELRETRGDNFHALQEQIQSGNVCLIGGLKQERPHPLMSRESFARDLDRGRCAFKELQFDPPKVFSRLSFGLSPDHADDLRRFGFEGVLLTSWGSGEYPEGSQAKLSWEASDGTTISALAAPVLDASDPASFLSLGWQVGESLDHQHVPTLVLAHWPGKSCDFLELLQIIASRTPALGKWMTANTYFSDTDQPYHQERLNSTSFRYNWLVENSPCNGLVTATKLFHLLQARCRSLQNLSNLAWQLENYVPGKDKTTEEDEVQGSDEPSQAPATDNNLDSRKCSPLDAEQWESGLNQLHAACDSLLDEPDAAQANYTDASTHADKLSRSILQRLAVRWVSKQDNVHASDADSSDTATGQLLVNPRSCPVRVRVRTDKHRGFAPESWNFATGQAGHHRYTAVDIPSLGFVVAPSCEQARATSRGSQQLIAEAGGLLQNEFLEAQIDPARGHLRSLHVPARRGNRLSLMIARRDRTEAGKLVYSEMVATNVRMLTSSNIIGLIRATGQLKMAGKRIADFEIDYDLWRGSRILEVTIRLSNLAPLADANPWKSAYVARLAWPAEAAIIRSYACGRRTAWPSGRTIAPNLIEIDETDYRTHYLTGGLAFHRRTETRFLETILAADTEHVEHRIGIAVDLPYPTQSASDFIDQRYTSSIAGPSGLLPAHGWLVNADVKNVNVDLECPLVDASGSLVGLRLFLTECEGRSTNTRVRLMHTVAAASRVDYLGGTIGALTAQDDSFTIALRSNEQCNVDVIWS